MKLHVIVPVRNERANIPFFYERARRSLDGISDANWNIIFVNNSSEDASLDEILELRRADDRVKVITLSKNFGYHPALLAGLSSVEGDYYALIDVDCEDPPELLPQFYEALRKGANLAYGVRSNRDEPKAITLARKLFYLINQQVADSEIVMWMGEFCMMTKQVRDAILAPKTTYPFIRSELGFVGFVRVGLPYVRAKRVHGSSHYNLWRMTTFAVGGILAGSTFPLRFVVYLAGVLAPGFAIGALLLRLSLEQTAQLAVIFGLYYLFVSLPILALYLARTYKNSVARPLFIVDRQRTFL